ncbi:hypothetical protein [Phocaeicola plebeius]|jgi:hypothetical protein|uniref:hypothetical protein n=1 Tax=Phocaeicola plebeius TaxID=310297 RepID=UPI00307DED42
MEQFISKQLNESLNGELNNLFERWKDSYQDENINDKFCLDGLVVKYKNEESGYDINQKWLESKRKIMFILKDCPDGWSYDARRLLVGSQNDDKSLKNAIKTRNLKGRTGFFKNIALLLYGLYNLTEENKGKEEIKDIKSVGNRNKIIEAFNEIPFAYVESKKVAGTCQCPPSLLNKTLENDGKFLAEEIGILKPNIIVCFDGNGDIFNNVVKNYFNGLIPDDECRWDYEYVTDKGVDCKFRCRLYYYLKENVLLFDSYHPTRLGKEEWKIYEKVISPFRQFFHKYKTFDVISK